MTLIHFSDPVLEKTLEKKLKDGATEKQVKAAAEELARVALGERGEENPDEVLVRHEVASYALADGERIIYGEAQEAELDPQTHRFVVHEAKSGEFYWTQEAENGETLSTSEMYPTRAHARRGAYGAGGAGAVVLDEDALGA